MLVTQGGLLLLSPCGSCGVALAFNPNRVPSVPDENGRRRPLCQGCLRELNAERSAQGLPAFMPHRDAYSPIPADEWPAARVAG